MTSQLSASRYELAARCPGAFTRRWRDSPNAYSEAGNADHAEDESAINRGDIPAVYAERWPGYQWRAEVAYAYDAALSTGRFLGVGINRAYGELAPFERPGTIDAEGWDPTTRHLVIADRKSFEETTRAAENPQLRFLANAAARVWQPTRVTVAINHQLHGLDVADLDAFDLGLIPDEIRAVEMRVARARSDARSGIEIPFVTGRWCRWCPAFDDCPKQRELVALTKLDDDDPSLAFAMTVVGDDDAPAVYALYKRIGILHKRIAQSLHAMAASRPIPIGNGRFFGRRESLGNEKLNGDIVYKVLRELHGQAVADEAVIRQATKKRLDDTLKGQRGAAKAVLAEVRKRGGVSQKQTSTFEEFEAELRIAEDEKPALPDSESTF